MVAVLFTIFNVWSAVPTMEINTDMNFANVHFIVYHVHHTTVSLLGQHKKEEKERLARVGDWSEHVSSSGKKYYYNCRTEVSQWEKPPEWLEWERTRAKETSNRSHDKSSTRQGKTMLSSPW